MFRFRPSALPRSLVVVLVLATTFVVGVGPALAADSESDPVISGLIEMLEAELSESIVLQWLEASPERPRLPTPSDLIALRKAGASDDLLSAVLERADRATPPAVSSPPPEGTSSSVATTTKADETGAVESAAVESAAVESAATRPAAPTRAPAAAAPAVSSGPVETRFSLSYSPYVLEDEEGWDFFVYLDGEPLSYVPESSLLSQGELTFLATLEPGEHRLRFAEERHGEDRKGRARHETRVADMELVFELGPERPAEVEVVFSQSMLRSKNPISYRVAQGGRVVALDEKVGGEPDQWVELCEDLEATLGDDEPSRSERKRLDRCLRWSDWWSGVEGGPSRAQVLKALARFDYRPTPKNQRLR